MSLVQSCHLDLLGDIMPREDAPCKRRIVLEEHNTPVQDLHGKPMGTEVD